MQSGATHCLQTSGLDNLSALDNNESVLVLNNLLVVSYYGGLGFTCTTAPGLPSGTLGLLCGH